MVMTHIWRVLYWFPYQFKLHSWEKIWISICASILIATSFALCVFGLGTVYYYHPATYHWLLLVSRITSLVGEESSKERNKFEVPLPTFYIYYTKYLKIFQIFVCAFLYEYKSFWIFEVRISYESQAILQVGGGVIFLEESVLEFISYSFLNFIYIIYYF